MRREALQAKLVRPVQVAQTHTIAAPVGGWNTRDPLSDMSETDAVKLTNAVAHPGKVSVRKGATDHATDFPADSIVQTLMPYAKASSGSKLFAATTEEIFDATTAGAVSTSDVSGNTNGRWQHVMFTNSAGQYLIAVNGADNMLQFDGAAWTPISALGSVNTADLVDVAVYQERLFFVKENSMEVYYLATGAITGTALGPILFGQLFDRGGYVMAVGTWSVDGGSGLDDKLFVISSEGEVAVYSGINPAVPADWQLQGVYYIGRPLGRRCHIKYGSDVLLLTDRGIFPLSKARQDSEIEKAIAITDKIQPTFVTHSTTLFSTFGWEPVINTNESLLIVNVPIAAGASQFCMHLQGMGWSNFTNWNASCWAFFQGQLYYGTEEKVVQAYSGSSDFGSNINADIVPAFNYWKNRGQQKHVKMLRPIFSADGPFGYGLAGCTDFSITEPTGVIAPIASTTALWGVALWGVGVWGSGLSITRRWQTVANNTHSAFAPFIRIATNTVQPSLLSIDYAVEPGSVL